MNIAIIFAGGTGQRMRNTARPKQFLELYGKPIIIYTLEIFQSHPDIDAIIVPCVEGWHDRLRDMAQKFGITKLMKVVSGGQTSQDSKLSALHALKDICNDHDIILMHDAVRPLITQQVISDNIDSVKSFGSAITVDHFTETGIISDDGKTVETTVERQRLYIAKAPQSFYYSDILAAHESAVGMPSSTAIDTCTIMTTLGKKLHFVPCDRCNIKITTPEDYYIFKAIHDLRESQDVLGI
ncbi:MAG: 2-C-methyl-D-erythritol 4-phosphate cytidylyltransferase [Candidatus Fimivivens sp.]